MSFKAADTQLRTTASDLQTWWVNLFAGEPGWTVLHNKVTDANGYLVSVIQNVDNGYVLVAFFDIPSSTSGSGMSAFVMASSYDLTTSSVVNPVTRGLIAPQPGNVAFLDPVPLSSLNTASYVGHTSSYYTATPSQSFNRGCGAVVTRDAVTFGILFRTGSSSYAGFSAMFGAVTPASPSIEAGAVLVSRSAGGAPTGAGQVGGRVNKTPLSSTWPTATEWNVEISPWQPFANYGTDAYSIEPGAIPTTEAVVRRTGAADGRGLLRGTFKSFRFGTGTAGQQITDGAGDVWEYRPGGTLTSNSSTISTDISPFSGWWKVS